MTTNAQPTPETDDEYYKRILHRVIDAGVAIIGKVETDCTTTRTEPKPDHKANLQAAQAYGHVSRAIRRSILLAKKLANPAAFAAKPAAKHPATPARHPNHDTLKHVFVVTKQAIDEGEPDIDKAEILHAELIDRLEDLERDDELDTRSPAEIIAELCQQLGVPIPPRHLKATPAPNPYAKLTDDELNDQIIAEILLKARHPRRT